MTGRTTEDLLTSIKDTKIVVVGDVMLDTYIRGDSDRLSPEAPVPVVLVDEETDALGGAANVAKNLSDLGANISLIGVVGDGEKTQRFQQVLRNTGLSDAHLVHDASRPMAAKARIISRGQQIVRVDRESRAPILPAITQQLADILHAESSNAQCVIFSDYGKGIFNTDTASIFLDAIPATVYSCVDPIPGNMDIYGGIRAVTPNEREAKLALGMDPQASVDPLDLADQFYNRFAFDEVLITLGPRGMVWRSSEAKAKTIETEARQVFDVSGAGDTVISLYSALRAAGASIDQASSVANVGAGLVVEKAGTASVTPAEIIARVS